MLCPKCKAKNKDQIETCTNCGEVLLNNDDPTTDERKQVEEVIAPSVKIKAEPVVHQRIAGAGLKSAAPKSNFVKIVFTVIKYLLYICVTLIIIVALIREFE